MAFNTEQVRQAIQNFDFDRLFLEELGWDNPPGWTVPIEVDDRVYELLPVAEKAGMVAYVHRAGRIPPRATRMRIDRKLAKVAYEHLIVFRDSSKARQVWQWAKRLPGRPPAYREHAFYRDHTGEPLVQKLQPLAFDIDEDPSIVEVTGRTRKAFDVDRVTKRFYDRFKAEHSTFLRFVEGVPDEGDREWYASLMLNRLMFVYFVQKKGFLAKDRDYLRKRLNEVQELCGQDNFLSFYRHFLRRFFHEGLGQRLEDRDAELKRLIGDVPYLNGGIFDVHELERDFPDIEIRDDAFIKLFDFFDAYQWHLDERPLCADNEINPDVLGYIFEKYVNQKQNGRLLHQGGHHRLYRPEHHHSASVRHGPQGLRHRFPARFGAMASFERRPRPLHLRGDAKGCRGVVARGNRSRQARRVQTRPLERAGGRHLRSAHRDLAGTRRAAGEVRGCLGKAGGRRGQRDRRSHHAESRHPAVRAGRDTRLRRPGAAAGLLEGRTANLGA